MEVQNKLDSGITNDFLAMELKHALSALSEIIGEEITTADLLEKTDRPFKKKTQTEIHGNTSKETGEIDIIMTR